MTIQKSLYLTEEEELAAKVDVTGTQEENDPLIYMLSFLWQSVANTLSQDPSKHMGICQVIFPDLSFRKSENLISNCVHFPSQCIIRQTSYSQESDLVTFTEQILSQFVVLNR